MFVSGGKWPLSASDQCGHQKVRAIHFCRGKKKKVGVPVEQLVRRPPTSSRPGEGGAAKMDAGIASDSIVLGYDPVPSECDKC